MKSNHALFLSLVALTAWPAHAMDNNTLKNTVILTGLLTNTYAISQKNQFKPCDHQWSLGYQAGNDNEMHAQTIKIIGARCELQNPAWLPWGMEFAVLPTGLMSVWKADSGPYARQDEELALVPVGQFSLPLGSVYVDASFGLGPAWISKTLIGEKNKSTHLQFSDEMGVGISDAQKRIRFSFTYRHVSNADIQKPNNGVNYLGLGLTYRLN